MLYTSNLVKFFSVLPEKFKPVSGMYGYQWKMPNEKYSRCNFSGELLKVLIRKFEMHKKVNTIKVEEAKKS